MTCYWDMAIWRFFSKWPLAAILDLIQPEMAPFDPPSPKTHRRTKHEVDRMTRCWVMAIWIFFTLWLENGHRITETGHGMWFYILSNAAMQCIGWLDRRDWLLRKFMLSTKQLKNEPKNTTMETLETEGQWTFVQWSSVRWTYAVEPMRC